ncbi:MAG: alpha/beta fold hydrolase [candidate division KSB1 bacterium]|jgi:cephalosporin-C deacetylase-like acetyl esterase|nr:alpha/beta fold hydrolase [candidate division KSB1 bacterium]
MYNIISRRILFWASLALFLANCDGGSHHYSKEKFELGPVAPKEDLRNMLRKHIVRRSCELLEQGADRRLSAFRSGLWEAWRDTVRINVMRQLGEMPYGEAGCPLNIRKVSDFELPHCRVENILFESLKGWDVNASLFLPHEQHYPPPWKAIVVPVGHSSKTRKNYQIPAQVFASLGYAAIIFDPPGMAGEKQGGNDHFTDGVRGYLTGHSSNRYFIMDAIRCIDYLETRDDIDVSDGVGMTGVSGGGSTTIYASLIDERVRVIGPACCALPAAYHPVLDVYAPCAETMAPETYSSGLDKVDLLCALIPRPLLFMFGEKDEVFQSKWSHQIASDIRNGYESSGYDANFQAYADPGGHAYSLDMALRFVKWMDQHMDDGMAGRDLPDVEALEYELLDPERLFCYPRLDGNMFSLNREIAKELRMNRHATDIADAIRLVAHIDDSIPSPRVESGKECQVWVHYLTELMLHPENDIMLPATFMYPMDDSMRNGAVLFFDDRGRWTELRGQRFLAEACNFLKRGEQLASVLTVDLRGWGDTESADMPYDVASWAHRERWVSFVSAAMGDHVLAMRIRDALSAFAYLRSLDNIDNDKIVVGGHGLGAVVALHVAALHQDEVAGLLYLNGPETFEMLATSDNYNWSVEAFLPQVLKYYDIPELVKHLCMPVLLVNPMGPMRQVIPEHEALKTYHGESENVRLLIDEQPDTEMIEFLQTVVLD